MSRRLHTACLAGATLAIAALTVGPAPALAKGGKNVKAFLKAADSDGDKTISKAELDAYAKKRFAEIESDNDKTLDAKELKGRLSRAGMTDADPDKDKSVDEAEFVGYADKLFDEANGKGDDTLTKKELKTPAGKKLIKLLE